MQRLQLMSLPRRRWVTLGILAGLVALKGAHAGWEWLQRKRLARQVKRSFINAELEEALLSIKGVMKAFEKDVRDNVNWNWARDRLPSILVDLLILNTVHERASTLVAPPEDGLNSKLRPGDEEIGREAARYVRFASAAYGVVMLKGLNVMSWDAGWPPAHKLSYQDLNAWCITKHCGISREDLLRVSLSEQRKLHLPGYIVAVDEATRSVVLSVRGTFSVQDAITDLVCDTSKFMGGACHRGLQRGAELLLQDAKELVADALKRHEGYRLVICGHSLGGGVSILLTMLVLQQRRELGLGGSKVVCYAFAPPPVFGPLHKLSSEAHDAIHVFAFGNDMVTRMSVGNAFELFRDLKEVDSLGASLSARLRYLARQRMPHVRASGDGLGAVSVDVAYRYPTILQRIGASRWSSRSGTMGDKEGHPLENFVQRKLSQDFTEAGRPRELVQARGGKSAALTVRNHPTDTYQKLMIPGKIFHVRKLVREGDSLSNGAGHGLSGGNGRAHGGRGRLPLRPKSGVEMKREAEKVYWMERATPEEFDRLLMVDTAIVDHLPKSYEDGLHCLFGDGLDG